ncbi:stress-induced protein [Enterococcus cecorum]|uniref:stress-induced protein n=1 Tax=Enterococcus cecorum TaxID=44008 RepID=UPI0022D6A584|nr:stress-induced protein [Enterococcus cecorum]CAI3410530.1 stress-induced protein [Enterococcus cecorum]CAI3458044.1 stress-induced protein [Enterococcus cecorum]CAI3472770.1 stress-induced protein [Enterococcus cecorum]CAI3476902.1 stress-induced protein [Enterococcus cecorum]
MANEENLKKIRSTSEARELGKKGGKASGKSRRKKANLKNALNTILTAEATSETAQILEELGFDNTNEMAIMLSLTQQAMKGNVRAIELINKMATSEKDDLDRKEQKARIKQLELSNKAAAEDVAINDEPIIIVDEWQEDEEETDG